MDLSLMLSVTWTVSPEILQLGPLSLRWYGLLFALGFLVGFYVVRRMYLADGAPEAWLDKCFVAMVVGAVVGARLGHVFFYDWDYYSQHLSEIPAVWEGGLASHGGAMGIILALWWYSRTVTKRSILWILDKVVVPTALAACFIRLGNLMNSEIIGTLSDAPWAFHFTNAQPRSLADGPRHPVQIYESISYLFSFFVLYWAYWRTHLREKPGYIFGLFLVLAFGFRLILERFKESQGGLENALGGVLSTGQLLSIPFLIAGLYFMFRQVPTQSTSIDLKGGSKK